MAGGHLEHVADDGEALGAWGKGPSGLLGEKAVQKNGSHQDGDGVQEGRRVRHGWGQAGPQARDGEEATEAMGTGGGERGRGTFKSRAAEGWGIGGIWRVADGGTGRAGAGLAEPQTGNPRRPACEASEQAGKKEAPAPRRGSSSPTLPVIHGCA